MEPRLYKRSPRKLTETAAVSVAWSWQDVAGLSGLHLQQTRLSCDGTVHSRTWTNTYSISDASTKSVQNATQTSTLPGTPTYAQQSATSR